MPTLRYWTDILYSASEETQGLKKLFNQLRAGEYKEAGLHKIGEIYRVKLNRAQRVCFSSQKDAQGNFVLVLRRVFEQHDAYEAYINDANIQRKFSAFNKEPAPSDYIKHEVSDVTSPQVEHAPTNNTEEEYNAVEITPVATPNGVILLSEEQQNILQKAYLSLPAILNGEAGSGKTVLLTAIIEPLLHSFPLAPNSILYVADAKHVLKKTSKFFKEHWPDQQDLVVFKTYEELVSEAYPEAILVKQDYFEHYLQHHLKTVHPFSIEICLNECRMISGCTDVQTYLQTGKKQSLLADSGLSSEEIIAKKQEWWTLLENYRAELKKQNQFDLVYSRFERPMQYQFVLVDEAHVLSGAGLQALMGLAQNHQFLLCLDGGQRVKDRRFSHEQIVHALCPSIAIHSLTHLFRSPPEVVAFINSTIDLAQKKLDPNSSQKNERALVRLGNQPGIVHVVQDLSKEEARIKHLAKSPHFAIVTSLAIEPLQARYDTPRVFSPEEVIGLEFPQLLVLDAIPEHIFLALNKELETDQSKTARKADTTRDKINSYLNQLRVACTRVSRLNNGDSALLFYQTGLHPQRASWWWEQITPFLASSESIQIKQGACDEQSLNELNALLREQGLTRQLPKAHQEHRQAPAPNTLPRTAVSVNPMLDCASGSQSPSKPVAPAQEPSPAAVSGTPQSKTLEYCNNVISNYNSIKIWTDLITFRRGTVLLFDAKLADERTLFETLVEQNKIQAVFSVFAEMLKTPALKEKLINVFREALEKGYIRDVYLHQQFIIVLEHHHNLVLMLTKLAQLSQDSPQDHGCWSVSTRGLDQLVIHDFKLFSYCKTIIFSLLKANPSFLHDCIEEEGAWMGFSAFRYLCLRHAGFLFEEWLLSEKFFTSTIVKEEMKKGAYKGFNIAHLLLMTNEGRGVINKRWNIFNPALEKISSELTPRFSYEVMINGFFSQRGTGSRNQAILNETTPVFIAVQLNNIVALTELAKNGADLNEAMHDGTTPAMIAAKLGHVTIIYILAEYGADLNSVRKDGTTPVLVAAQQGHAQVILELARQGANLNTFREDGVSPVYMVARQGHIEALVALAENGADLNHSTFKGGTPILIAAAAGHSGIIAVLVKYKVDLNQTTIDGATPVFVAAQKGHVEVLVILAKHGADLNKGMNEGSTPVFVAAQQAELGVITALADYGADLNKAKLNGETPAYTAARHGHVAVITELARLGADLNKAKLNGETPAYTAAQNGHVAVITELARLGADLNKANINGETPAYIAAQNGHDDVIIELARLGADLNKAALNGETPFSIATKLGRKNVIKELVRLGVNTALPVNSTAHLKPTPSRMPSRGA